MRKKGKKKDRVREHANINRKSNKSAGRTRKTVALEGSQYRRTNAKHCEKESEKKKLIKTF